jgi:CheY-like chemotaxis protein
MPIMDGYEATETIRSIYEEYNIDQPMIVACTGHTEDYYIKKAWRYQIDEVLPKPTNLLNLKQILNSIIH